MKKIALFLAFIGMITLQSCSVNDNQNVSDNDTISEVWEFNNNVNFLASNNYDVTLNFPHEIYSSDMVLIYRLDVIVNGQDVWKLLPQTFYFNDGTLDFRYDFEFTKFKADVFLDGFDLEGISLDFRTNQILRVVVVPGYFGKNNTLKTIDYKSVVKALNIDESKIKKIN